MKSFKNFKPIEEALLPKQKKVANDLLRTELEANAKKAGNKYGKMVRAAKTKKEEVELDKVTKKEAEKVLGGPVKSKPKGPPGKHPLGYRLARSAARRAMKSVREEVELDEGAVALSTVEKEIRSNGGKIVSKDDKTITFTVNGVQRKIPVDRNFVQDRYYMQLKKMFEEVELDEAKFKVKVPDMPSIYVDGKSVGSVKDAFRKILKPESLSGIDIERVQPAEIKKDYRDRAASKVTNEEVELDEANPVNKANKKKFVRQVGLDAMRKGEVDPARGHSPQRFGREKLKGSNIMDKPISDISTPALQQYWNRHKDEERPAPAFAAKLRRIALELKRRKELKTKTESTDLQESHFKVGDKVMCRKSGMEGEIVKVDPAGKGKYYTVKRSDGSMMKFAPDELKKVVKEAKASPLSRARKDAMRAIRKDKDLAFKGDEDDVKASDDDVKAASKNPVMQLRRISDLDGTGEMEFKNGKKAKVSSVDAKKLLKMFDMLRMPKEKEMFQNIVGKSVDDLKAVLKSPIKSAPEFKQKIKGTRYMTGFKWED
jgi:hypothetical protein